jgi:hypothetical protein
MEALSSFETSVLTRATRRNIPEDGILLFSSFQNTGRWTIPRTLVNLSTYCVRFEVFTAVTQKNGVFWDVTTRATRRHNPEDTILLSLYYSQ